MKWKSAILLLLSLHPLCFYSQIPAFTKQRTVDSLFALLKGSEGSFRIDILNDLAINLAPRTFDSSLHYADAALKMQEEFTYPRGEGMALFSIGNSYFFRQDLKSALAFYHSALRILEPLGPSKEVADLLFMLGSINEYVRNTNRMIDYYHRAVQNYQEIGDSSAMMLVYLTIGGSYYYKVQALNQIDSMTRADVAMMMDSAIKYNEIAYEYYRVPHANYEWMSLDGWMATIYNYKGCYLQAKGDSTALFYFLKALDHAKAIRTPYDRDFFEGLMRANLGDHYYFKRGQPEIGYPYALSSLGFLKKTYRYDIYAAAMSIVGQMELDKGRYSQAEKLLNHALSVSDTFLLMINHINEPDPTFRLWGVTQNRSMRIIILKSLVQLSKKAGNYMQALHYQEELEDERGLQAKNDLAMHIIGLEADYQEELKNKEIARLVLDNEIKRLKLNQTRIYFAVFSGIVVIILLVVVLWIQRKRFLADRRALLLEQKLLRSRMNPHFLFNSLSSIQNYIVTEQPDKASLYLSKFSRLVRNILDNSVEEYVVLEREISTIQNYLELQKVRYAGKFDFKVSISDDVDIETLKVPPMLAQPFIENAIEHGMKHRERPGHIDIRFGIRDNLLVFEIEDNGIGREKAREISISNDPLHKSLATSLTRERLVNLNRKLKNKILLEITDLKNTAEEPAGTRVTFGIPLGQVK